jgi:hypothetical protein
MKKLDEKFKEIDGDVITFDNREFLIKQPDLEIYVKRTQEGIELDRYVVKVEPSESYKIENNEATVIVSKVDEDALDVTLRDTCIIQKNKKDIQFKECIGVTCDTNFDLMDTASLFQKNEKIKYDKIVDHFISKENLAAHYDKCIEICSVLNEDIK